MSREMVWIEQKRFAGWGCSQCAWLFNPSDDLPGGSSLEGLMRSFELRRNQEFELHACTDHPKPRRTGSKEPA
jgi:hypothetical protein